MATIKNPTIIGGQLNYNIQVITTNCTYSGATYIQSDFYGTYNTRQCSATITITPDAGYRFKTGSLQDPSFTILGAGGSLDKTTGILTIINPTGSVLITCECIEDV